MSSAPEAAKPAASGPWSPFKHSAFALLWVATLVSNTGTWMNDVGAGWLMTTLAPSPLMVALVQAATTLPVFLFALVAGAVADIVDRRWLLIVVNVMMGIVATLYAVTVWSGAMTAELLLLFTFLLGAGAAFIAPAWQAIVPSLVPRSELPAAVALNSMGINVSRAIGPALAGVLIAAVGLSAPFALNALSFAVILLALFVWRPEAPKSAGAKRAPIASAIVAGLRYAMHSPPLKATLVRAIAFFVFASAYWAMLPLIARELLNGGPGLYGLLLGAVGAGAVGGAIGLPRLRKKLGANGTALAGSLGTALALAVFALSASEIAAIAVSLLAGASWIAVLSSLNVSAQTALPDWVRARGLSIFLTIFFGSMSLGSLVWGQVASTFDIATALLAASALLVVSTLATKAVRLSQGEELDLSPSMHWPAPVLAEDTEADRGPVMITVEYRIAEEDREAFLAALDPLMHVRRRDGALDWYILQDAEDPTHWTEAFVLASWAEHLRQHDRVTKSDREIQDAVNAFHRADTPPRVHHMIAP